MIRLSKSADYGLMAMRHLALLPQGCCCSARELAQGHKIPPALMAKLMQRLARRGLVSATHGIKGGYRIARPAQTISLREVIEAIEGPLAMTDCHDPRGERCDQDGTCTVKQPLLEIQARIAALLAATSVRDLGGTPNRPVRIAMPARVRA
ncbi:MAG TPA: Rrf2 family transcriptional regulator [Verrucomicrobiae bacterium]|nr:Rrf2 family transcriptional regulator [Verrucomicrobiae bacterium]